MSHVLWNQTARGFTLEEADLFARHWLILLIGGQFPLVPSILAGSDKAPGVFAQGSKDEIKACVSPRGSAQPAARLSKSIWATRLPPHSGINTALLAVVKAVNMWTVSTQQASTLFPWKKEQNFMSHPASPINLLLYTHFIFKEQSRFIYVTNSARTRFIHSLFQRSERTQPSYGYSLVCMYIRYVLKPFVVFILFYISRGEMGKSEG